MWDSGLFFPGHITGKEDAEADDCHFIYQHHFFPVNSLTGVLLYSYLTWLLWPGERPITLSVGIGPPSLVGKEKKGLVHAQTNSSEALAPSARL